MNHPGPSSVWCRFMRILLFLVLFLCDLESVQGIRSNKSTFSVVPSWQTVIPDTGKVFELSEWKLDSNDEAYVNLTAHVPGDLLTDLMRAGIIDDPYLDRNFLTQSHVWMGQAENGTRSRVWTYSTFLELPESDDPSWTYRLVVEGIKMGAEIAVNEIHLGTVPDQFLRYTFTLTAAHLRTNLRPKKKDRKHRLTVKFDPLIQVNGRFTACSGGWDWAPYTQEYDTQGKQVFTFGIVRPIYVIAVKNFAIAHVVPRIYYKGPYPRKPLSHPEGDFEVQIEVHLEFLPSEVSSWYKEAVLPLLSLYSSEFGTYQQSVQYPSTSTDSSVITFSFTASKDFVELWWPNGLGKQPLYDILVGIEDISKPTAMLFIQKRLGFRTAALVTINETDDAEFFAAVNNESEGSGQHGMYFRINGAIVMARGANFIPMDQLEGRLSDKAHRIAVKSAADGRMNMLRVWGGGMVLPGSFYDACDEEGVLLYHDMMFVEEAGHGPSRTETVRGEIRHLVRSLASHPSIILWNGCNECSVIMGSPTEIYATFVMQTVAEEDNTRSIWPSSPSKHGWRSGVYTLDGKPNGTPLATWDPSNFSNFLESHGPYKHSYSKSHPGVNGMDESNSPYDNTPPKLEPVDVGPSIPNVFTSEFGSSVMSSFESMTGTLSPAFWSIHGNSPPDSCKQDAGLKNTCDGDNTMAERNYACDSHVIAYFGENVNLDSAGEFAFQEQLYYCVIAQTMWMKGEIEKIRSKNSFGVLIWQMNENWPTGGWGVVEYGTVDSKYSQVIGGRWKPLMHLLESALFRDIVAACGKDNICYVRNDSLEKIDGLVSFEAWQVGGAEKSQAMNYEFSLDPGQILWLALPTDFTTGNDVVLLRTQDTQGKLLAENVFLWMMPKDTANLATHISVAIASLKPAPDGTTKIVLSSDRLALYVVLTTRAQGRFSENSFVLRPAEPKTVTFLPFTPEENSERKMLEKTLRVEHLGFYKAFPILTSKVDQ